jgi:hypothetical protein
MAAQYVDEALQAISAATTRDADLPETAAITLASAQVWAIAAVAEAVDRLAAAVENLQR